MKNFAHFVNEAKKNALAGEKYGIDDPRYGTDDPRSLDELEKLILKHMKVKERGDGNIKVNNEINIVYLIYKNKGGKKTKKALEAIAREELQEVRKTLSEGAITKAIRPSLEGEVKVAVEALENLLKSTGAIIDYKHADELADCIIDIIDAAKAEERAEYKD